MPTKAITKVHLEKFRGATTPTNLEFDGSKPLVLIFGDNGTGKSTIGNSIDFVCNKTDSFFEGLSGAGAANIKTLGANDSELRVTVHCGEDRWTGTIKGTKISVDPDEDRPVVKSLRRRKILHFIEAQPKDKYEVIREFLDFDSVETSEGKLRDAARKSRQNLDRYAALKTQSEEQLTKLWQSEGARGRSATEWAAKALAKDLTTTRGVIEFASSAVAVIDDVLRAKEAANVAAANLTSAESNLSTVENEIADQRAQASKRQVKLVKLLTQVREVIAAPYDLNECPACLSPYDVGKLRGEIDDRIRQLQDAQHMATRLADAVKLVDTARANEAKATEAFKKIRERCVGTINQLPEILKGPKGSSLISVLAAVEAVFDASQVEAYQSFRQYLYDLKKELQKEVTLHDAIKVAAEQFDQNSKQTASEHNIAVRLEKALEIAEAARKEETRKILSDVHDEVVRLWNKIHPGEFIQPSRFEIKASVKGSLVQHVTFDGEEVLPQPYFSESHLDTLGFCYWLAIAKYSTKGDAILLLDDVFTSVDIDHTARLIDLLLEESANFCQIILTTHQRRWHNAFRFGACPKEKVQVIELSVWDRDKGIRSYPSKMEVDKLEDLLNAAGFDRQSLCGKAGVLLEQAFDDLTIQYRCSMPRGVRSEYTLDNYVSGVTKLFPKLKVVQPDGSGGTKEIIMEGFLNDLKQFVTVRNQVGAHFNLTAEEFSDAEILRFGRLSVDFLRALLCPDCISMANREDKATGEWACQCKATRMFPKAL